MRRCKSARWLLLPRWEPLTFFFGFSSCKISDAGALRSPSKFFLKSACAMVERQEFKYRMAARDEPLSREPAVEAPCGYIFFGRMRFQTTSGRVSSRDAQSKLLPRRISGKTAVSELHNDGCSIELCFCQQEVQHCMRRLMADPGVFWACALMEDWFAGCWTLGNWGLRNRTQSLASGSECCR